ncbi:major facilitator superfamily domain-containing protein, partial [Gaertneriomyces semiglobifer]
NDLPPPPEGGYGWVVVAASFAVHIVTIGAQAGFGVFNQAYKDSDEFGDVSRLGIAFVGSLGTAMVALGGMPAGWLADRFGYQLMCAVGGIIEMIGYIAASYSKNYAQLLVTHGFLTGLGVAIAYFPAIGVVSQWFQRRRGVAVGIAVSGSGIGGLALSPLTRALVEHLGWRWALRIIGFMAGGITLLGALLIRVRYRSPRKAGGGFSMKSVAKDRAFILLFCTTVFGAFGYFIPFFYLPSFATNHGMSSSQGALLLGLLNGASAVGRLAWGYSSDKLGHVNTLFSCFAVSALCMLVYWPFATTFGALLGFVLIFGIFIGGFVSLLPTVAASFFGHTGHIATITGMLYTGFFFGNLFGSPIGGAMLDHFTEYLSNGEKEVNFTPSVIFGGGMMAIATCFVCGLWFITRR